MPPIIFHATFMAVLPDFNLSFQIVKGNAIPVLNKMAVNKNQDYLTNVYLFQAMQEQEMGKSEQEMSKNWARIEQQFLLTSLIINKNVRKNIFYSGWAVFQNQENPSNRKIKVQTATKSEQQLSTFWL